MKARRTGLRPLAALFALAVAATGCSRPDVSGIGGVKDRMAEQRDIMLRHDIAGRGIRDPAVLGAMRAVPRHEFVPDDIQSYAYDDRPLPIGLDQTISQPYIVAAMTELIQPKPDHVVLEIGTGSGYQAAVLAKIVRRVYSVEIIPELGDTARERLERLGYTNVSVLVGDGYQGWPLHAPFDGILVTCGAEEVPPPLLQQLKPGGRMVIPVGPTLNVQSLMLIEKRSDGSISSEDVMPVRFVPLTGKHGRP
jgi:protein-L-isoaspartate(D-aspartate) O-methyltransferase